MQTTKRAGWIRRGVKEPESIGDHMYRMGVMALVASDIPGIDRDRFLFSMFLFLLPKEILFLLIDFYTC